MKRIVFFGLLALCLTAVSPSFLMAQAPGLNIQDISNIDDKSIKNIEINDNIEPIPININNNINDNDIKLYSVGNSKLNNTHTFDKTFFINK